MGEAQIDPELAEVCQREHARLVGLLALYVGDRAIAEDIAQGTLVRLHQHWSRVRSMDSPRAWLSTVGLNLAGSWWWRRYSQQRARRRVGSARNGRAGEPEPNDVLAVRAAIAALPPRQRSALILRYYAGLSMDETAAALGCSPVTVRSLTHSAINTLRLSLDVVDDMIELEEIPHG